MSNTEHKRHFRFVSICSICLAIILVPSCYSRAMALIRSSPPLQLRSLLGAARRPEQIGTLIASAVNLLISLDTCRQYIYIKPCHNVVSFAGRNVDNDRKRSLPSEMEILISIGARGSGHLRQLHFHCSPESLYFIVLQ